MKLIFYILYRIANNPHALQVITMSIMAMLMFLAILIHINAAEKDTEIKGNQFYNSPSTGIILNKE